MRKHRGKCLVAIGAESFLKSRLTFYPDVISQLFFPQQKLMKLCTKINENSNMKPKIYSASMSG